VPDLSYTEPIHFIEDNGVPFDYLIRNRITNYVKDSGHKTQETKSIYYENKEDFLSYLTFRCVNNRSTLERPNIDHMCSDEFCFEDWRSKA